MKNKRKHSLLYSILTGLAIFMVAVAGFVLYCWNRITIQRCDATRISIQEVEKALKIYASKHSGTFPASIDEMLGPEECRYSCLTGAKIIPCDSWGMPIHYESDGNTFKLRSAGPDTKLDTADDITN
jgi:hypothetical protein